MSGIDAGVSALALFETWNRCYFFVHWSTQSLTVFHQS